MVNVVIIGQNEGAHAKNIVRSLPSAWKIVYVADRCTDDTISVLKEENRSNMEIIDTTDMRLEGRQTSFCRNLGLSHCDPMADVLFLDGDRYPVDGDIFDVITSCKHDTLCLPVEKDARTPESYRFNQGRINNGFFSCGVFLKNHAIKMIQQYQNGELFNTSLQSHWGIEDTSLGDLVYHFGLSSSLTDKVHLRGGFDKCQLDNLDVLVRRLRFRDGLNVRWV